MCIFWLVIVCFDGVGIVVKVSNFLVIYNGWIIEVSYYFDNDNGWFFMCYEICVDFLLFDLDGFCQVFVLIVCEFFMEWWIIDFEVKKCVVLMVSKEFYCLVDLLYCWYSGELDCEIFCVIVNYDDLCSMVEWYGILYFYVFVDLQDKQLVFDEVFWLIDEYGVDCIVLVCYMQILLLDLCCKYVYQVINIYYSFLLFFIGVKLYYQVLKCGVKLIGVISYYVIEELDVGLIIEQDVVWVIYCDNVEDMVWLGKDVEKLVFVCGLCYYLEDCVLVYGNKMVVFD